MGDEDLVESRGWSALRRAWLPSILICVCIIAFVWTLVDCSYRTGAVGRVLRESLLGLDSCRDTYDNLGALSLARVWVDGEWWRLATTTFLHGSWLHLILNTWSLWSVGIWAQRAWGGMWTLLLFALGAVGGALGSMAWAEAPMVVGASAGVLAIAGALLVGRLFGDAGVRRTLAPISPIGIGVTLGILFLVGAMVPVIAQAGHVGGLVAGLAAAWADLFRGAMRLGIAAAFVVGGWELAHIARRPDGQARYHEFVGFRHLDRGEPEAAIASLEHALEMRPEDPVLANAVAYGYALAGTQLERAGVLVDAALAEDPTNANYLDTKGWVLCRQGDTVAGHALLDEALAAAGAPVTEIEEHLAECARARVLTE